MNALFEAHIKSAEKVVRAKKSINMTLEKRRSLIIIRERKSNEMRNDLHNLIDYVNSIAKEY